MSHKIDPNKLSTNYLSSYETAKHLVDSAVESHVSYWDNIRNYQDHIKGKKPRDPAVLRSKGMSWAANFNYGKARAKHERGTAENVAKMKDSIFLSVPELNRVDKKKAHEDIKYLSNPMDREITSMAVSRVLYDTFERDPRFSSWLNQIEYPSYSFGYSAVVHDPRDWMGTPVHTLEIAFEDRTTPAEVRVFVIFDVIKAIDFYDKWLETRNIRDINEELEHETGEENKIRSNGWSIEALEEILFYAYGDAAGRDEQDLERWEDVLPGFDADPSHYVDNTQNVNVAKIFYRNLDKTWDEVYIPYNNKFMETSAENSVDLILYKEEHGKKSQTDFINLIVDSGFTESKYIQDMRGLAKFSVEDSVRYNRKRNSIEDKLTFAGQPMFAKPNTQVGEGFKIGVSQGYTIVENGFTLLPTQPNFDLTSHIASINLDQREHIRDTTQYDAKVEGRTGNRATKSEVAAVSSEVAEAKVAKNSVKMGNYAQLMMSNLRWLASVVPPDKGDASYDSYEYFFSELSHQLQRYIDQDLNATEQRMVCKRIIKEIKAVRIDTYMSDPEAISASIQMAETPFGRNRMKRILLMSQGVPRREINSIVPLSAPTDGSDARTAAFENDMFMTSAEDTFVGADDHIVHMDSHQLRTKKLKQKVSEGAMELKAAFSFLANSLPHQEKHLAALEADPTLSPDKYEDEHKENIKFLERVKSELERQARQQQEQAQQAGGPEEQKHQAEIRRAQEKADHREQRYAENAQNKAQISKQSADFQRFLEKQEHDQQMAMDAEKAKQDQAIDVAKQIVDA